MKRTFKSTLSIILVFCYLTVFIFGDYGKIYNSAKVFADEDNVYGDVNVNGVVDTSDLVLLAKRVAGKAKLSEQGEINADVSNDGAIDGIDLLWLIKFLTNRQSIVFPAETSRDSDEDGIPNLKEINIYKTDPYNPDTDGDGIDDGDELKLKLDPVNPATHGYPDNEYILKQTISAEYDIFKEINTADNPYRLAVTVEAAGWAENSIRIERSSYSYSIDNKAIFGNIPELFYPDKLKVKSFTLDFNVTNGKNIQKLNIFKYFEDINMLVPVKTKYDIANNLISATIDEFDGSDAIGVLGTFCLIDTEMWLTEIKEVHNSDFVMQENYGANETDILEVLSNAGTYRLSPYATVEEVKYKGGNKFQVMKLESNKHYYALFDYVLSKADAQKLCTIMGGNLISVETREEENLLAEYLVISGELAYYWLGGTMDVWDIDWEEYTTSKNLTQGQLKQIGFICEWETLSAVTVPKDITVPNEPNYFIGGKHTQLKGTLDINSGTDTDRDGISDYNEVNWDLIAKITGDKQKLPTYKECVETKKPNYVDKDNQKFEPAYNTETLPVISNPSEADSDGDFYNDIHDSQPLKWQPMKILDGSIDDTNSISGKNPSTSVSPKDTDGKINQTAIDAADGNVKYKNEFLFVRDLNATYGKRFKDKCVFALIPEKSSDYMITVSGISAVQKAEIEKNSNTITVKYGKNDKKTATQIQNFTTTADSITFYYALKSKTDYKIYIDVPGNIMKFNVKVSQNNWVYAPNGALCTNSVDVNQAFIPYAQMYISPRLLIEATVKVLPDSNYEVVTCYTKADVDAIMAKITYDDVDKQSMKMIAMGAMETVGTVTAVLGFYEAEMFSLVWLISTGGGMTLTYTSNMLFFESILDYYNHKEFKKAIEKGNFSISCSKFYGVYENTWNEWNSKEPYFNKYLWGNRSNISNITVKDVINFTGW